MESKPQGIHPDEMEQKAKAYAEAVCKSLKELNDVHRKKLKSADIEPMEPLFAPDQFYPAFYWSMAETLEDRFPLLMDEEEDNLAVG